MFELINIIQIKNVSEIHVSKLFFKIMKELEVPSPFQICFLFGGEKLGIAPVYVSEDSRFVDSYVEVRIYCRNQYIFPTWTKQISSLPLCSKHSLVCKRHPLLSKHFVKELSSTSSVKSVLYTHQYQALCRQTIPELLIFVKLCLTVAANARNIVP
jgi:hypothetical protein